MTTTEIVELVRERLLLAVRNNHLTDPADTVDDDAYDAAVTDCAHAIRTADLSDIANAPNLSLEDR